jgi:hypothetical protein
VQAYALGPSRRLGPRGGTAGGTGLSPTGGGGRRQERVRDPHAERGWRREGREAMLLCWPGGREATWHEEAMVDSSISARINECDLDLKAQRSPNYPCSKYVEDASERWHIRSFTASAGTFEAGIVCVA